MNEEDFRKQIREKIQSTYESATPTLEDALDIVAMTLGDGTFQQISPDTFVIPEVGSGMDLMVDMRGVEVALSLYNSTDDKSSYIQDTPVSDADIDLEWLKTAEDLSDEIVNWVENVV